MSRRLQQHQALHQPMQCLCGEQVCVRSSRASEWERIWREGAQRWHGLCMALMQQGKVAGLTDLALVRRMGLQLSLRLLCQQACPPHQ